MSLESAINLERLKVEIETAAHLEAGVKGAPGVYPEWVYEAREGLRHAKENGPPWLDDLLKILGWQGGTIHQALAAVNRLVQAEKERERKRDKA